MRKLSRKSALLAVASAVCAFAVPSMASAAGWGVVGSSHALTSTNLSFSIAALGPSGMTCSDVAFGSTVTSAALLTISTASFTGCTGTGASAGCASTTTTTGLPCRATGLTTNNVEIRDINVDMTFSGPGCTETTMRWTGSLSGGVWSAASHNVTFTNATGTTAHVAGVGSFPMTVNGVVTDVPHTLTLS